MEWIREAQRIYLPDLLLGDEQLGVESDKRCDKVQAKEREGIRCEGNYVRWPCSASPSLGNTVLDDAGWLRI